MKKLVLLLSVCALSSTLFMSYQGGALTSAGDRTGRTNVNTTCKSCHSGTTYGSVTIVQEVTDSAGAVITSYKPGAAYTVKLTINKTAGTPVGYSFQWVGVKAATTTAQAGTPSTTQTGTAVRTSGTLKYVEQSVRLATNVINFTWVAPAAGTGSVKMFFVGMAVNGNNNDGGTDTCSPSTNATLTEAVVSTERIDAPVSTMKVVPNPVAEALRLQINTIKNGNYTIQVTDLAGKVVATQTATLTDGDNNVSLEVANLAAGMYAVRLLGANSIEATTMMVKK
jgi:Secretion system C-terminal sorting domain